MKTFLAFSVILVAVLSCVILATQFGIYQRIPFFHYAMAVVGLGLMVRIIWREYNHKRLVMNLIGVFFVAGFVWWTLSYSEYEGEHSATVGRSLSGQLSDLSLQDTSGADFDLERSLAGTRATLIIFYRGFW